MCDSRTDEWALFCTRMFIKRFTLLFLLAVIGGYAVAAGLHTTLWHQLRGTQSFTITMEDDGFYPASVRVQPGDTVVFVNNSQYDFWPASNNHPSHDIYPEFDAKKAIPPGLSWSFRIDREGHWYFHDHMRPLEGGKIIVGNQRTLTTDFPWGETQAQVAMDEIVETPDWADRERLMTELARNAGPAMAIKLLNESPFPRSGRVHLLSHKVGEVAYEIYGEDGLPYCQKDEFQGCIHGILSFGISDLGFEGVEKMVASCKDWSTYQYHMCLHGVGHAFLVVADYDVFEAVDLCERLVGSYQMGLRHCLNGVFMENAHGDHDGFIPPLHPHVSFTDLLYPCNAVNENQKAACYSNQVGWWLQAFFFDLEKTVEYCENVPVEYQEQCADNAGRVIATVVDNDPDDLIYFCGLMQGDLPAVCLTSIAGAISAQGDVEHGQAICKLHTDLEFERKCVIQLVAGYQERVPMDSDEYNHWCSMFKPELQTICKTQFSTNAP